MCAVQDRRQTGWFSRIWEVWYPFILGAYAGLGILALFWMFATPIPAEERACARAFERLMQASTAVELDRAKFLLKEGRCPTRNLMRIWPE